MLREVLEVLVLPNSFRSIDFSRKGIYYLIFKLYDKNSKKKVYAYPFHLRTNQKDSFLQSSIDIETGSYKTQSFFISFNSEKLEFSPGGCLFRIEAPWEGNHLLQLEIRLMHIDSDSIDNPLIRNLQDSKEKAKKLVKIQKHKDYYGDIIFGQFDYFCSVQLSIHFGRLDYKFRLHDYQLSDFASKSKKQEIKKQQEMKKQIKKLCPEELQKLFIKSIQGTDIEAFYKKLVVKQLQNYQKMFAKQKKFLQFLGDFELISFWKRHQMIPKDLSYLQFKPFDICDLKAKYNVTKQEKIYLQILKQSNSIGKNIRYIWMINYELQSYLLKRRFSYFREQYEIDLFFESRRKFFRDPNSHRQVEVERFKMQKNAANVNGEKYPLIFAPLFDFPSKRSGSSLIVMVHGFQGSDYDMDLVKNFLMSYNKNIFCYVCRTLQGNSSESIESLGQKFANETLNIMAKMGGEFQSVSFIGYSLGGIVIRAGLKHLDIIKDRVNVLLTLASPHLGISKLDNLLVKTGVWYMTRVSDYPSMRSLSQMDDFLQRLSEQQSLTWIKKFMVLGCKQDDFVPGYSAKIVKTGDKKIDLLYDNIIKKVQNLTRIQVWFDSNPKMFDKLIGRQAHIQFLESKQFCQAFFSIYARVF